LHIRFFNFFLEKLGEFNQFKHYSKDDLSLFVF
jgi:hypothetical protein